MYQLQYFGAKLQILITVVLGVSFLISCFILCKKQVSLDENGKERVFKKTSKRMFIIGIVCFILFHACFFLTEYNKAKKDYEYYHSDEVLKDIEYYRDQIDIYTKIINKSNSYDDIIYYGDLLSGCSAEMEYRLAEMRYNSISDYYHVGEVFATFFLDEIELLFMDIGLVLFGLLFPLYMFPTKVARTKNHAQITAITWINVIFGCTIIFWIVMLIWANSEKSDKEQNNINKSSLTDKLSELQVLKESNIISEEEFEAKRKSLIDKM